MVHAANGQDKTAIRLFLKQIPVTSCWKRVVLDAGYHSPVVAAICRRIFDVVYEIVKRMSKGFEVLPRR